MAQSFLGLLCLATFVSAQGRPTADSAYSRAWREYRAGQFGPAAQDFQSAAKANPSDIFTLFYWGESLFKNGQYKESNGPLEQTIELNKTVRKLSEDQRRLATDHLATSYSGSGDLQKLEALLNAAIRQDPRYPTNYYNLACWYAAKGNKAGVFANLLLAFQNKDRVLQGDHLPDPRRDDRFRQYLGDPDFMALLRANGLEEGTDPEDE